jgi:hypothetical protein
MTLGENILTTLTTLGEKNDVPDDLGEGLVMTIVTTCYHLVTTPHDYTDDPCGNSDDL